MTSWEKPRRYALRVWRSTAEQNLDPLGELVATYAYSAADAVTQFELENNQVKDMRYGGFTCRLLSVGPWNERGHGKWPLQEWPEG